MRKTLLIIVLMLVGLNGYAYEFENNGFYFRVANEETKEVAVSKAPDWNDYSAEITIPSEVSVWNGEEIIYKVTSIDDKAFQGDKNIVSVSFPNTILSIGASAFEGCRNLKSVVIPKSVTSIGAHAFSCCDVLTDFDNQSSVVVDNEKMFGGCWAMGDSYDKHVYNVSARNETSALWYAIGEGNLDNIIVLKVTGTINSWDFMVLNNKLKNLRCIDLSDASIVACDYEFHEGVGTIDNELPDYAFEDHVAYEILVPKNITSIGQAAFRNTVNLRHFLIPHGVKEICDETFYHSGIESIDIPNGVKSISYNAFYQCNNLKSVTIPESMEWVASSSFQECYALKGVEWNAVLCNKEEGDSSSPFFWNTSIEAIKFGSKVEYIPSGLLYNPQYNVDNQVKTISIPSTVKTIGQRAFSSCPATDVYAYTVEPIEINDYTFLTYKTATLHIPKQAYYNYYWADVWCKFQNIVVEEGVEFGEFYLNNDYNTNENTGTVDGTPNVDMGNESGWIVDTEEQQKADTIFVNVDGDKSGSIIAGNENLHANRIDVAIKLKLGEWQFCCFPYDIDVDIQIEYDGVLAIYEYDGKIRAEKGNSGWKRVTNGKIHKFKGYIIQGSKTADMHVKYDNVTFADGNESISLDFYGGNTPVDDGWNMIGNPYLSYYSIKDMEFNCPVMVWDKTNKTYLALRNQDDDYRLAPFEGFFVQAPKSGMHVGFMKDFRQTYQNTNGAGNKSVLLADNTERKLINLSFSDGTLVDRTRVVFNETANSGYELGIDMVKMMSQESSSPQVYTVDEGIYYSINERPQADSRVNLGVKVAKRGTYTFAAERADGAVVLTDSESGATVDLSEQTYAVELEAGVYNNRFVLNKSGVATGFENIASLGIDQNEILDVYDISGCLIKKNVTVADVKNSEKGIFILKSAVSTYKVVVK